MSEQELKQNCEKCGSDDIDTKFKNKGVYLHDSWRRVDNEFIYSQEQHYGYQLHTKKEHLHRRCITCNFDWRENTLNNQAQGLTVWVDYE